MFELSPDVFWAMTPPEYEAIRRAWEKKWQSKEDAPLTIDEYEEMKRQFPDG